MLKNYINKFRKSLVEREDELKLMIGKQLCFSQNKIDVKKLSDIEFKVFSQWGEDGILQYIISKMPINNKFFIEFGVENYNESNTRFLMMNNNWSGFIIDGSKENIEYVKNRDYFHKYDLTAINTFVTKDNINDLISETLLNLEVNNDIGLLSVDIDGVDYWVLEKIRCIKPAIIICEYSSIFGNEEPLTVPYDKNFIRTKKHYSNLYYGANLKAFSSLLEKKGYMYIGSNMQNTNAFFIKIDMAEMYFQDIISNIGDFEVQKTRESRNINGELNFIRGQERLNIIKDLPLINLETNTTIMIDEIIKKEQDELYRQKRFT